MAHGAPVPRASSYKDPMSNSDWSKENDHDRLRSTDGLGRLKSQVQAWAWKLLVSGHWSASSPATDLGLWPADQNTELQKIPKIGQYMIRFKPTESRQAWNLTWTNILSNLFHFVVVRFCRENSLLVRPSTIRNPIRSYLLVRLLAFPFKICSTTLGNFAILPRSTQPPA